MPAPTSKPPTIDEVRRFFEANASFFKTPLSNQKEFRAYYENKGEIKEIEDYSSKLIAVLNSTFHKVTDYSKVEAIILWKQGKFDEVLEHKEIRQFIMDNMNHPAIISWQKEHPPLLKDIPPTELSQDDIKETYLVIKQLQSFLKDEIKKLQKYLTELKNASSTNKYTASNIEHIKKGIICLQNQSGRLTGLKMDLDLRETIDKPVAIATVKHLFYSVRNELEKTVKNDFSNLHQENVRNFGEKFLNIIYKILGHDGYKSELTKQAEQRDITLASVSRDAQRLPDATYYAVSKMKAQMKEEREKAHDDTSLVEEPTNLNKPG